VCELKAGEEQEWVGWKEGAGNWGGIFLPVGERLTGLSEKYQIQDL